jgi:hypothetical protein
VLGILAIAKPWRGPLVGQPLRHPPQQLQRQKEKGEVKAVKARTPDLPPKDVVAARKVEKGRIPLDHLSPVLSAMNGRKPESAIALTADTPTPMELGRALAELEGSPAARARAKAAASPRGQGLAVHVQLNLAISTSRANVKMEISAHFSMWIPLLHPRPVKVSVGVRLLGANRTQMTGRNPPHPIALDRATNRNPAQPTRVC